MQEGYGAEEKACKNVTDPCRGVDKKPPTDKGVTRVEAKRVADRMADIVVCNDCLNARRCRLSPWQDCKTDSGETVKPTCCGGQTPHHIVEKSCFGEDEAKKPFKGMGKYKPECAPCVCAEGTGHSMGGTHELMHVFQKASALAAIKGQNKTTLPLDAGGTSEPLNTTTYAQARDSGIEAFQKVFNDAGCDPECIKKQLDAYHQQCDIDDGTPIKACTAGPAEKTMSVQQAEKEIAERSWERWVSTGPQGAD